MAFDFIKKLFEDLKTKLTSLGDFDFKQFLKTHASIDLDDPNTSLTMDKNVKKTSIMFMFIILSGAAIYYISTDKDTLTSKLYYSILLVIVPLVIGVAVIRIFYPDEKSPEESYEPFLRTSIYILAFVGLVYFGNIIMSSASSFVFMNYMINVLLVLTVLGGLAITYFLFSNYIKQQTGAVGLFARILFYLPCLFADFVNYIKKELSITSSIVYVLLILEILFVVLYMYLPIWINKLSKLNSNLLMNNPVDLDKETTIAGSKHFLIDKKLDIDDTSKQSPLYNSGDADNSLFMKNTYRDNNYSISFWSYVNAGTMSDSPYVRESNILKYSNSNDTTRGKPKIAYMNNGTHKGNKYVVYLSNHPNAEPYDIVLNDGHQKWNHFAIVYHDYSADLFVNGKLLRSEKFNDMNRPKAGDDNDVIVIGQENGLKGAICNVSYYPYALVPREIATTYNLLRFKNPPVLGV